MNRRAFLKAGASASALLFSHPAWCVAEQESAPADDEILAQTKGQIERYRQGEGTIKVQDPAGKPVPGIKVILEQLRHDFLFGCNLFLFGRCGEPELEEQYRQRFAALLNYCTLGFYWAAYEAERGQPRYSYTDQVVEWALGRAITCKGHPLVWDDPVSSPRWLPDDPKEIQRLSTARVRDIVSRFKDRIDIWDVVNEPTHLAEKRNQTKMGQWGVSVGTIPYVAEHLKVARAANPQATLLVNDYRTDPPCYKILENLRENDRPLFDAIGIQSHMHTGVWPLRKIREVCDTFGKLGLPIHFTETTIVSGPRNGSGRSWSETTPAGEARQADQTERFYTTLFAQPSVQAITWWDFADRGAWQRAPAGWLRADMSPKPVYERLMSLIKGHWWTKAQGITDARGEIKVRAFYGTHRLTAELPGGPPLTREVHWERGKPNRFQLP